MKSNEIDTKSIDVAIVTMRDDEFTAVLDRMPTDETIDGQRRYEAGAFTSTRGHRITYVVTRCVEQGPGEAQRLSRYIVDDLKPKLVVLCGIAGAMPTKDVTLGDVVCATYVHDLSLRAAEDSRRDTYRSRGAEMAPPILSLLGSLPRWERNIVAWKSVDAIGLIKPKARVSASKLYGDDEWKARTKASILHAFERTGEPKRLPIVTARPLFSGVTLLKSAELASRWAEMSRDCVAIEMELGGVMMACGSAALVLCIRGISDIVGFKRDEAWTGYACRIAASFLNGLLRSGELDAALLSWQPDSGPTRRDSGSSNPFAAQLIDRFNIRVRAITHCLGEIEAALPRYSSEIVRFRLRFLELHQAVIAALEKSPPDLLQMDDLIREINKLSNGASDRRWFEYARFEYNRGALSYDSLLGIFTYTGLGMYTGSANFELNLSRGEIHGYSASSGTGWRSVVRGVDKEPETPIDPFSHEARDGAIGPIEGDGSNPRIRGIMDFVRRELENHEDAKLLQVIGVNSLSDPTS